MKKVLMLMSLSFVSSPLFSFSIAGITVDGDKEEFKIANIRSIKTSPQMNGDNGFKTIVFGESAGLNGQIQSVAIMTYPNPVTDYITISGTDEADEVVIVSSNGNVVRIERGARVDIGSLSAGIYILSVKGVSVRFIKK